MSAAKPGGLVSLFPPRAPTFFSGDSGSPVLSQAFLPHASLPRPRARSAALKPGLEGRRKPRLRRGSAQRGPGRGSASPRPAGGVPGACRAPRSLSPNPLTHPAPFPCPEPGSSPPPPPDGHPEVATRLGGIGAREAASRSEKRGGDGRGQSWNFLLQGFRVFGVRLGKPNGKEAPKRSVPIPTARALPRKARCALARQVGRKGRYLPSEDQRGGSRRLGKCGKTGPAACPP